MKLWSYQLQMREVTLTACQELEDETNLGAVEIPLWLIPNGVMVTFRGIRVIFERERGPPWQDVLTQMLEEQNSMLGDN